METPQIDTHNNTKFVINNEDILSDFFPRSSRFVYYYFFLTTIISLVECFGKTAITPGSSLNHTARAESSQTNLFWSRNSRSRWNFEIVVIDFEIFRLLFSACTTLCLWVSDERFKIIIVNKVSEWIADYF